MAVEFNSAANLGLTTTGPNLNNLLDKLVTKELARLKPTEALRDSYKVRHGAWEQTKTLLQKVSATTDPMVDRLTWSSKKAISSDPDIVTATASISALPGKYPLMVDKVASFHQMGSQYFKTPDDFIGNGTIALSLIDERPYMLQVKEGNNTLQSLADSINNANLDISANVVKVGDDLDKPYRMLLTSKQMGKEGRIIYKANMQGGEAPDFNHRYTQPTPWVFAVKPLSDQTAEGLGASSTVPTFYGKYTGTGNKHLEVTFTALTTGKIAGDDQPMIGWKDNYGRSGQFKLGKFDYDPNTKLDLVDGIQVSFSPGDLVINDSFTLKAKPDESKFWWVKDENKPSVIYKPTPWAKQIGGGLPVIGGEFQGDRETVYNLKVRKGGVIGTTDHVYIDYTSDAGESGSIDVGLDYKPGHPIYFGKGLTLTMQKGVLQTGFTADFKVEPPLSKDYWWLFPDGSPDRPTKVDMPISWANSGEVNLNEDDLYDPNSKRSNAKVRVTGEYFLDQTKTYKVTVKGNGRVGVGDSIYLEWDDGLGRKGLLNIGTGYKPGTNIELEGGLSLNLNNSFVFNDDYFTFTATSPTIVPPNDTEIRLNPLDNKQGGQKFTSSTRQIKNAIEGVVLDIHQASDKIVTITIEEDRAKAKEAIAAFVKAYNEALIYMKEALKYDPETKIAGPLQAEYQLANIQDALRTFIVDAIPDLPRDANTLTYAGISLKKDGTLEFNEAKLDERLASDYDKVANLFRSNAVSNNVGLIFINSTPDTKNSGPAGYAIDVNQAATQGAYISNVVAAPFDVIKGKDKFQIELDGKMSKPIELADGPWTLRQVSKKIKREMTKEPAFKGIDFEVTLKDGRLRIDSGSYGANSTVKLIGLENADLPFLNGTQEIGKNVGGSINNHPASGTGRVIGGMKGNPEEGIRFISTLRPNQLNPTKPEAVVVYTTGKGALIKRYLNQQLKEKTGTVDTGIKNVGDRIQNLDESLARGAERVDRKKDRLSRQFANVEERLSKLNAVKADITQQFQNIGT